MAGGVENTEMVSNNIEFEGEQMLKIMSFLLDVWVRGNCRDLLITSESKLEILASNSDKNFSTIFRSHFCITKDTRSALWGRPWERSRNTRLDFILAFITDAGVTLEGHTAELGEAASWESVKLYKEEKEGKAVPWWGLFRPSFHFSLAKA